MPKLPDDHTIVSRPDMEVLFRRNFDGTRVVYHHREVPNPVAAFAMELLRAHAGITAHPDGEDTAGRRALRRDLPEEAVNYACKVAELAFAQFRERDWLVDIPAWAEVEAKAKPEN